MEEYMMRKNGWTFSDLKSVAWDPYEQAMNSITDTERVFVVKLSHEWLAVGTKQKQMGAENDQCVLCSMPEDTDHLFKCPQRETWRTEFIQALKTELKTLHTAADTRNAIVKRLEQWMNKQTIKESPQDALGWGAFIKGYIHEHWVEEQDKFYRRTGTTDDRRNNGKYWARHLITFLWQQTRKLWKGRNEQVHTPNNQDKDSPQDRKNMQHKIRLLYQWKGEVREADRRNFFAQTVDDVIEGPTRELRAWITTYEPPIKKAMQDALVLGRLKNRDIRDFFERLQRKPQ
jgi:hypothetical protein